MLHGGKVANQQTNLQFSKARDCCGVQEIVLYAVLTAIHVFKLADVPSQSGLQGPT